MFLIDKSGSLLLPIDDRTAPCTPGCGQPGNPSCAAGCSSRVEALKLAMNDFLGSVGASGAGDAGLAWVGLALLPSGSGNGSEACVPTSSVDLPLTPNSGDLASEMGAAAAAVNMRIQSLLPGGSSPIAESLRYLGSHPPLNEPGRAQYIVLMTDGLPNCNPMNANSCSNPSACKCTVTSCIDGTCTLGCLDKDSAVLQINALRSKGIKTFVFAIGQDTTRGDGPDTLNAMAEAGGVGLTCPLQTDAECGADNTCDQATRLCRRRYYQSVSAAQLSTALTRLKTVIR